MNASSVQENINSDENAECNEKNDIMENYEHEIKSIDEKLINISMEYTAITNKPACRLEKNVEENVENKMEYIENKRENNVRERDFKRLTSSVDMINKKNPVRNVKNDKSFNGNVEYTDISKNAENNVTNIEEMCREKIENIHLEESPTRGVEIDEKNLTSNFKIIDSEESPVNKIKYMDIEERLNSSLEISDEEENYLIVVESSDSEDSWTDIIDDSDSEEENGQESDCKSKWLCRVHDKIATFLLTLSGLRDDFDECLYRLRDLKDFFAERYFDKDYLSSQTCLLIISLFQKINICMRIIKNELEYWEVTKYFTAQHMLNMITYPGFPERQKRFNILYKQLSIVKKYLQKIEKMPFLL